MDANDVHYRYAYNQALTVAMYASPHSSAQNGFSNLVNSLDADGDFTEKDRLIMLLESIVDGLRYNTWPTGPISKSGPGKE